MGQWPVGNKRISLSKGSLMNTEHQAVDLAAMAEGTIVQCIGAVIDVEFPRDRIPKIYDALVMEGSALVLEVQQQLSDGVVRTICLGSSEGLCRGLKVKSTYQPIRVPVGKPTLGRIMDVLGRPIDEA